MNQASANASIPLMGWALLLTLSLLWGGSFFFIQVIVAELSPILLVSARVILAALTLWVYIALTRTPLPIFSKQLILAFLVMGLLNNVMPFYLLSYGQSIISSSLAAILNASTPFFALIVGHVFTNDDRISLRKMLGITTAFIGIIVIFLPALGTFAFDRTIGMLACLNAALSYGFAAIWGRRFGKMGIKPTIAAALQLTASSFILILLLGLGASFGLFQLQEYFALSPHAMISMILLAIFSTGFAYLIFFKLLSSIGGSNTALVTMLVPISAMILGSLFLSERITLLEAGGFMLVATGLAIVDGRIIRLLKKSR
ncbi:MAG: DMT family transporter [Alphaproteobacteria bacterium]